MPDQRTVLNALRSVRDPELHIVTLNMVKDMRISDGDAKELTDGIHYR